MAKSQSRRSVSVRGETYRRLRAFALANERSASGIVEELLAPVLDAAGPKASSAKEDRTPRGGGVVAPAAIRDGASRSSFAGSPTPAAAVVRKRPEEPRF